ncbi:LiaF transmembrane domain-containing protein [Streptococcus infantis]|uniref:LiaF transmembrane domain-containing protein n=1 Tax=Streptococcus infantis TaxID=68892 RepID=UPI0039C1A2B9
MKKKAFGIVLLVLAALVLLQGNFGIPSLEGEIWPLIGIGFFAYQSVEALLRRHFTSASVTALVALMIANHFYDILPIPNQSLFWASVLIVLGVSMLTHTNRTWNGKKWWYDGEKTILTDKEVAFGAGTFYKQDQELVEDEFEVGFGNAKIYYDNAEMLGDSATLKIEVGFGNAVIYVPQHWRVDLKVETFCGAAKADAPVAPTSKTLIIRGDVAFGKLGVVYVK